MAAPQTFHVVIFITDCPPGALDSRDRQLSVVTLLELCATLLGTDTRFTPWLSPAGGFVPHRTRTAPTHPAGLARSRRTRLVGLIAGTVVIAVPAVALGAPGSRSAVHRSYRQTLAAYTPRFETPVAPGVDLSGYSSAAAGYTANSNILTVDLTHPGVSTGVLSSKVTTVEPVSGWAQQSGAVAAINGDYYDIYGTSAPDGAVIRGGVLQKGTRAGQSMTGLGSDGALRTGAVYLDGTVTWGGSPTRAIDVYNSDLSGASSMPKNGLAVLDGAWGVSPLSFPHAPKKTSVVIVGGNHKVIAAYPKLPARVTVPSHGLVLVGTGTYAGIARLKKGIRVTDTIAATTDAPSPFQWGLGAGLELMSNGSVVHNYPDDTDHHDSRTALGWSADGKTMYVVTVERGAGSFGEGVNEIADEMAAAGATDAVLLDGGGSTTLVARKQGDPADTQIGALTDGFQRHVPIGIGVFVPKGSGQVFGFNPTLDAGAVFPGLHRTLGFRAWDEWYGAATLDPSTATITTDNAGLLQQNGNRILALRPGNGHVIATAPTTAPGSPGTATGGVFVQVLQPLTALLAPGALRLTPGTSSPFQVTGTDADGDTAPILASDVTTTFDPSLLAVTPSPDGTLSIQVKGVPEGEVTPLTLTVGSITTTVAVHIGFTTVPLVNPSKSGTVHVSGAGTQVVAIRTGVYGLKVSPTRATAAVAASPRIPFPTGTAKISVTAIGDGGGHAITLIYADAHGRQHKVSLGALTGKTAQKLEVAVPATGTLVGVQIGAISKSHGGFVTLTGINART